MCAEEKWHRTFNMAKYIVREDTDLFLSEMMLFCMFFTLNMENFHLHPHLHHDNESDSQHTREMINL